ncbi:MAG: CesT family type III secretion system chaperone [Chlamydiota bacterium]|nr:CesT family type III secretion system chaperone [Chlamydiota bacterium]
MITDEFGALLDELGKALDIPNLTPDDNDSCLLKIEGNILVQLEMDKSSDCLLLGIDLGVLPLGRYREDLFEAALKSNSKPPPLLGIFGFSKKEDHLVIFDKLWTVNLSGERIADHLALMVKKAKIWKEAIEHSEVPVIDEITTSDHVNIFGLKP